MSDEDFDPQFDSSVEGYTVKFISRHYWRLRDRMEFEDLMQDARIVFIRCKRNFRYDCPTAGQFMGYYKRALFNHITELCRGTQKAPEVDLLTDEGQDLAESLAATLIGETDNSGALLVMVSQAPQEVQKILKILLNPNDEQRRALRNGRMSNSFLCSLLGEDPNRIDIKKAILRYLSPPV